MAQNEKLHVPLTEKLKTIPEIFGIRVNEEPVYRVLSRDGDFEVRRYDRQIRAEIHLKEMNFDRFRENAFRRLAAYIFGGNHARRDIAMTAPVLQHREKVGWRMSFVLPAKFVGREAPSPLERDIELHDVEARDVAVVRYSGNNSIEKIHENETRLREWLKTRPELHARGPMTAAQYDAPFVLPFLKRNEMQIEVDVVQ